MELAINFSNINWLAVMVATVLGFLLGGCWYSPILFGRFLPNLYTNVESRAERNLSSIFVLSFALLWFSASFLAGLLGTSASTSDGIYVGLAIGLFFVFPAQAIAAVFGARPIPIVFINGGYFILCFAAMGAIIGTWH